MAEPDDTVIWMRPEKPARGRTPSYSRADIAAVAVRIADAEGLEAVSMRRVAGELGAGTMSLYRYVRNKQELYALMSDHVVGEERSREPWPLDAEQDWPRTLRAFAHAVRATLLAHPWFATVAAVVPPGPNVVGNLERVLAALDRPELDTDDLFRVVQVVMTFAQGYAHSELAELAVGIRPGPVEHQHGAAELGYMAWLLDSGEFPYLERVMREASAPHRESEERFEAMLDWLIEAIVDRVEARR